MKTISRYIMTLALLITAATGAWAQTETLLTTITASSDFTSGSKTFDDKATVTFSGTVNYNSDDGWNFYNSAADPITMTITAAEGYTITSVILTIGDATLNDNEAPFVATLYGQSYYPKTTISDQASGIWGGVNKIEVYGYETPASGPEVTLNEASTEASFTMPAFDATVNYTLVRDMQDEANPVAFSGLPTNDEPIVVKKGDDGKYQPAEELNIQLIDPVAATDAQNIIAADGITVKVLVGAENELGAIEYDHYSPITLENFLADMKPGYYWIKAEPTDENSLYDGTVYSSEFTVVEQYNLTVKPANDFSKGKIDAVTVGSQSVTIDANTGEATKTGIAPDTEVKIKAKRGYIIEKVEAKKKVALLSIQITGAVTATIYYLEGETWGQAIQNHPTENSAWEISKSQFIYNQGKGLSAHDVPVFSNNTIDPNANYRLD